MENFFSIRAAKNRVGDIFHPESRTGLSRTPNGYIFYSYTPEIFKDKLIQIDGMYWGRAQYVDSIAIGVEGKSITAILGKETFLSPKIKASSRAISIGNHLSIIAFKTDVEDVYVAITVINGDDAELFDNIDCLYGKAIAISNCYVAMS